MAKNTIYCSQCGKGNIVDSVSDISQFTCISCNSLNVLKQNSSDQQGTRRLKDVYEKNQQSLGDRQNRLVTFRRKKTLVDKNIDLLERVEAMEHEAIQMKNEYLDLTKELSKAGPAVEATSNQSSIEEVREMFIGLQEIVLDVQEQLNSDKGESKEIDLESVKLSIMSALESSKSEPLELDGVMNEFKTVQHIMNAIAGDVRSLKQEISELKGQVSEMNGLGIHSSSNQQSFGLHHESEPVKKVALTTQILAHDLDTSESSEKKQNSVTLKPVMGPKKFKAISEKLKNLKL